MEKPEREARQGEARQGEARQGKKSPGKIEIRSKTEAESEAVPRRKSPRKIEIRSDKARAEREREAVPGKKSPRKIEIRSEKSQSRNLEYRNKAEPPAATAPTPARRGDASRPRKLEYRNKAEPPAVPAPTPGLREGARITSPKERPRKLVSEDPNTGRRSLTLPKSQTLLSGSGEGPKPAKPFGSSVAIVDFEGRQASPDPSNSNAKGKAPVLDIPAFPQAGFSPNQSLLLQNTSCGPGIVRVARNDISEPPSAVGSADSEWSVQNASLKSVALSEPPQWRCLSPGGEKHWVKKTKVKLDREPMERANAFYKERWQTLMLYPGQGGTFGFGEEFINEHGRKVHVRNSQDALKDGAFSLTKHLLFYGNNVNFIGTKDCRTCVGVYFEIEGGRVFCAHINAGHYESRSPHHPRLDQNTPEYKRMRRDVTRRMEEHIMHYCWHPWDVKMATLRFVCPNFEPAGWAVCDGISDFLSPPEHLDHYRVMDAHGFVCAPGAQDFDHSPGSRLGKIFLYIDTTIDEKTGKKAHVWEEAPYPIEEVFIPEAGDLSDLNRWTYTAGQWRTRNVVKKNSSQLVSPSAFTVSPQTYAQSGQQDVALGPPIGQVGRQWSFDSHDSERLPTVARYEGSASQYQPSQYQPSEHQASEHQARQYQA